MEAKQAQGVVLSELEQGDVPETARVCMEAFNTLHYKNLGHLDFGLFESALGFHQALASHPKVYGVVARDAEGRIVGSNFLDQRGEVASVGPISVDPNTQATGVGRALMQAVIDKGVKDGHKSIRLVQEAYNLVSFSLYVKLGFDPKDQLNFFMGRCAEDWPEPKLKLVIRPMTADDLAACAALHKRVVGVEREQDLAECLSSVWSTYHDEPLVAVEEGSERLVGYATSVTLPGHSVGECDEVVARLHYKMTRRVSSGRNDDSVLLKVIGRLSPALVKWALTGGLRLQRNATLMALGTYSDPVDGVYVPSIGY
jgi:predicted N-acetyltransferase YhbS